MNSTQNQKTSAKNEADLMSVAKEQLIQQIKNKKIQAVVREVSNRGNTRVIDFMVIDGERLQSISDLMADVLNLKQSKKHFGLIVKGCGMDMVFSTLFRLFDKLGLNTSNANNYSLI